MKIDTKYFGEIEIDNDKIIHFENGIMGFEEYKDFTLLYDSEAEKKPFFSWLQCVTEKSLAFPVVNPLNVIKDYNPVVEDALLEPLGELKDEDIVSSCVCHYTKGCKRCISKHESTGHSKCSKWKSYPGNT